MTSTLQVIRTLAVAGAALLYAAVAAPQPASQSHDHGDQAAKMSLRGGTAAPSVIEQVAALDNRIQMLVTDMRMLTGEMKVDVMASLLSTMIERQSLMEREMKTMRDGMMRRMRERRESPAASLEQEPGGMCAPSN